MIFFSSPGLGSVFLLGFLAVLVVSSFLSLTFCMFLE